MASRKDMLEAKVKELRREIAVERRKEHRAEALSLGLLLMAWAEKDPQGKAVVDKLRAESEKAKKQPSAKPASKV